MRRVWKWIFIISLIILGLLSLFTVSVWVLVNIFGALFHAVAIGETVEGIPFGEFLSDFVGSPVFYVCLADGIVSVASAVGLIATEQKDKNSF